MTASARAETGGSVVGNDQESVDTSRCVVRWRRRQQPGQPFKVTECNARLEEVKNRAGAIIGYRCTGCGAHYTDKRVLIKDEAR